MFFAVANFLYILYIYILILNNFYTSPKNWGHIMLWHCCGRPNNGFYVISSNGHFEFCNCQMIIKILHLCKWCMLNNGSYWGYNISLIFITDAWLKKKMKYNNIILMLNLHRYVDNKMKYSSFKTNLSSCLFNVVVCRVRTTRYNSDIFLLCS